jgi:hypothetical protein
VSAVQQPEELSQVQSRRPSRAWARVAVMGYDNVGYVDKALRYGKVVANGSAATIEHDLETAIGTDMAGNSTNTNAQCCRRFRAAIRVHVRDGIIQAAHPL